MRSSSRGDAHSIKNYNIHACCQFWVFTSNSPRPAWYAYLSAVALVGHRSPSRRSFEFVCHTSRDATLTNQHYLASHVFPATPRPPRPDRPASLWIESAKRRGGVIQSARSLPRSFSLQACLVIPQRVVHCICTAVIVTISTLLTFEYRVIISNASNSRQIERKQGRHLQGKPIGDCTV